MISRLVVENSFFEIGSLHYEKGELDKAESYLLEAKKEYLAQKKIGGYFKICQMLIRSYVEMKKMDHIDRLKKELQSFVLEENVEMSSKLYYTLGVCSYFEGAKDQSLTFFNQSFNMALAESSKEDMCYALSGKAIWYASEKEYTKAMAIIENVKLFLEAINLPAVEAFNFLTEAQIYKVNRDYEKSLATLLKAFQCSKKSESIQFLSAYILIQFGTVHKELKNIDLAESYFNLAKGVINPSVHIRAYEKLQKELGEFNCERKIRPDIKIDLNSHTVEEINKGSLELKNQFILLELLVEFVKKRDTVLTKSDVANVLWRQDYDPTLHDNKIYVTIRRLRKALEPDPASPKYILRTKEGYQLSSTTRVEVIQ